MLSIRVELIFLNKLDVFWNVFEQRTLAFPLEQRFVFVRPWVRCSKIEHHASIGRPTSPGTHARTMLDRRAVKFWTNGHCENPWTPVFLARKSLVFYEFFIRPYREGSWASRTIFAANIYRVILISLLFYHKLRSFSWRAKYLFI